MPKRRKIGIVGTGFISRGLSRLIIKHHPDLEIIATLTRRDTNSISDYPAPDTLTCSVNRLIDSAELIIECSGDVVHATQVIDLALKAGLPVVTMNSEFHVTTGSFFVGKGMLTEAEGDQPGCLAALHEDIVQMGFDPLVYGNMKGYLSHNPSREDMEYWAKKQGFSVDQTTSFTDGTKLQIEQALIANGMGATISRQGMEGLENDDPSEAAKQLGAIAEKLNQPIADFVVSLGQPPGVFITARHDEEERGPLRNIKMGDGPYYVLMRNYHLCAIEIIKTVRRVLSGGGVLLDNSSKPQISVTAIAKKELPSGTMIERGIGRFEVRGEAINVQDKNAENHVPIGLLNQARLARTVEAGEILTWSDVELPDSLAVNIARNLFAT